MKGAHDLINAVTKTFEGLASLILLLLIIAQFIAYFNYSNMATVLASSLADILKRADIGPLWLLLLFIFVTFLLDAIIPGNLPKWAIFAPVFVPLMYELGVAPQTVLAAYRIGDSPTNVITPLMVYLPFIVLICQRYKKESGVGTVVSLMLPITRWCSGRLDDLLRHLVRARHPTGAGCTRQAMTRAGQAWRGAGADAYVSTGHLPVREDVRAAVDEAHETYRGVPGRPRL